VTILLALANNPDYHPAEALPGLELGGSALNVSDWKFRKAIQLKSGERPSRFELDLVVLRALQGWEFFRFAPPAREQPGALPDFNAPPSAARCRWQSR